MAVRELNRMGLFDVPIVGLAKQREEVFVPGRSEPILIPHERGALKLLQRIRDEAHRFANGYNELLLRKRMKESILDDCPGVSPQRKKLLLQRFGSVARLRKATVDQIAAIPGISAKNAADILAWVTR
jgi:excinuclease ABC subunit C